MRTYIYALVALVPSPFRAWVQWVADRLFAVWDDIGAVLRVVRSSWLVLWTMGHKFVWVVARFVDTIAGRVYWLAFIRIPQFFEAAMNAAVAWARDRINTLTDALQRTATFLVTWFTDVTNRARADLLAIRDFFFSKLNDAIAVLNSVVRIVGALLTSPERLAVWLVGAMFTALLRFALANAEAILAALWAQRTTVALRTLDRTEAIIARIL
jgi:hypothetical protein